MNLHSSSAELWSVEVCVWPAGLSPLEKGSREGETPVLAWVWPFDTYFQRVELFGIAAQSGM